MKGNKKVIVVGGGIMGASAAWHLAKAGARVTVIERAPGCSSSATASSFGWVGASASTPADDPQAFAERLLALQEFARLERDLGCLPVAARGALLWGATDDETAQMIAEHRAAGTRMESLSRAQLAAKVAMLAAPPALAAWAPDDFALEPAELASQLIAAAQAAGAGVRHGQVDAITTAGSRVSGVLLDGQALLADAVVLANGHGARQLAAGIGLELALQTSPAVLLRFAAPAPLLLRHLLCAQELELRPAQAGTLLSAADYPPEGKAGLATLAARTAAAIAELFQLRAPPVVLSVSAAQRPMTISGAPLCARVGQFDGLHALVAHPGVILAPRLGRLCAEAVLGVDGRAWA